MNRLYACCVSLSLLAVSCTAPGSDAGKNAENAPLSAGSSRLKLELVDAPTHQVREINVTIRRVTAHSSATGWVEVFRGGPVTVDLLTLKTRVMDLGFRNLPAGKITQIRLYLEEGGPQNVVLPSGDVAPLKVPSGVQSGIKIHGPFELAACNTTTVQLDFDGHRSIWYHPTGNGGDWVLRPVIRTKKVTGQPTQCDASVDAGDLPSSPPGGSGGSGGPGTPVDDVVEGPGSPCNLGSQCLSGVCQAGVCAVGAQGTPCNVGVDCASGLCSADGSCSAPVTPTPTLPSGAPCLTGSQCTSGVCTQNVCDPGLQGQPCQATADCSEGFVCNAASCEADIG